MPLYIYYKVPSAQRLDAKLEADRILAWASDQNVTGQLLLRPEVSEDGFETWMEVYENAHPYFEKDLESFAASTRLSLLAGPRRIETFIAWK